MNQRIVLGLLIIFVCGLHAKFIEFSLNVETKIGTGKPQLLSNRLGNKRHHRFYISSDKHSKLATEVGYDYKLDMLFGSRKQKFEVSIDTGSSDLWIPSKECLDCYSNVRYDCSLSTTCTEDRDHNLVLTYMDGPVSGHVAFDDIDLGSNIIVKNVSFMLVSKTIGHIYYNTGIMGLGMQSLSSNPNPTLINRLFTSRLIDSYAFSVFLTLDNNRSKIVFGGWDKNLARAGERPVYANIISSHSYTVGIDSISVGFAEPIPMHAALIDSGNSMMSFSKTIMDTIINNLLEESRIHCYYQPLSYSPQWLEIYCNAMQGISGDFPNLELRLPSNQVFKLTPSDYLENCSYFAANTSTLCLTKFETSDFMSINILGAAFMQAYYTIFDLTNHHIGFVHSSYEYKVKFQFYDIFGKETSPPKGLLSPISTPLQKHGHKATSKNEKIKAQTLNKASASSEVIVISLQEEGFPKNSNSGEEGSTSTRDQKVVYTGVQKYAIMGVGMCLPLVILAVNYLDRKGRITEEKRYGFIGLSFLAATFIVAIALSLNARV